MRRSLRLFAAAVLACLLAAAAPAERYGLGRTPTPEQVAGWNIDILPDGTGLPPGQGSVAEGEHVFQERCASCHGDHGEAGDGLPVARLAGGQGTLTTNHPVQTVGSYWPYATTLFDYIRRAMPLNAPQTLSDDEVYAVSAYVLHLNGILSADATLDRHSLPAIHMPNRGGFVRTPDQPGR